MMMMTFLCIGLNISYRGLHYSYIWSSSIGLEENPLSRAGAQPHIGLYEAFWSTPLSYVCQYHCKYVYTTAIIVHRVQRNKPAVLCRWISIIARHLLTDNAPTHQISVKSENSQLSYSDLNVGNLGNLPRVSR